MKKFVKKLSDCFNPTDLDSFMSCDNLVIDVDESLGNFSRQSRNPLFLGRFTDNDLTGIIDSVGLTEHLHMSGFDDIKVQVDVDDSRISYMRVYSGEMDPDRLLIDLRLSMTKFVPESRFFEPGDDIVTYDMIRIEWLSAHNPAGSFSDERPQLPGQKTPGLGILRYCFDMMKILGREISRDGFMDVPDHIHGAIMYAKRFKFFDPRLQGILRALMRDLKDYSLSDISWGIITGTIIEQYKKEPQKYTPSEQVFYLSEKLRAYFHTKTYREISQKYYRIKHFEFDYDEMVKRRSELIAKTEIADL